MSSLRILYCVAFVLILLALSHMIGLSNAWSLSPQSITQTNTVTPLSTGGETVISSVAGGNSNMYSIDVDSNRLLTVSIGTNDNVTVVFKKLSQPTLSNYDYKVTNYSRTVAVGTGKFGQNNTPSFHFFKCCSSIIDRIVYCSKQI